MGGGEGGGGEGGEGGRERGRKGLVKESSLLAVENCVEQGKISST